MNHYKIISARSNNSIFLISRMTTQAYSDPSRTSEMELFTKIIKGLKPLTIFAKNSILDV